MINISFNSQEKNLIQISKAVEYQNNLIKNSISSNHFSKCLLDTAGLLSLLKIDILTPSNYYLLFTDICDIIEETIEYYIREKTSKGIKIKYIYDSIQQSQFLIPRLYLMIISGAIYLELNPLKYREILYDLINMMKCVQNPLRGFWIRYFLFKYIKDKLPIKNGEYINDKQYYIDYMEISILFLMQNLEYMNHYILRIRKELLIDNEILPEKERDDMILCEQEIIEEISNIKELNKTYFESKILPKFLEIISDSENDSRIQQMLIDSIIKYFKIDLYFEFQGIHLILYTLSRLMANKEVDIIFTFINLLNIYKKFIKSQKKLNLNVKNDVINKINNVYHLFLLKYNEFQISYNNIGENEFNKFIDLDIIFMKFSIKILLNKEEKGLKIINNIMDFCLKRINAYDYSFNVNSIKKISSLIGIPLKKYSIFELDIINKLIIYLDYNSRKEISLKIIKSLYHIKNKNFYLDSIAKVQKLIEILLPLISEIKDDNDEINFINYLHENEKNIYLCKLLSFIKSKDPKLIVQIFIKIKNFFISGFKKSAFFTLSSLIYYIINFINRIEIFYKYKIVKIDDENDDNIKNKIINYFDINDKGNIKEVNLYFTTLMKDIIELLKECLLIIQKESSEKAFKLYLLLFNQMNKMKYIIESDKTILLELFQFFFDEAINIFKNYNDLNSKYNLFTYLCGYLPSFTHIINDDKIINIIELLENEMLNINSMEIQFNSMINISNLYFLIFKDKTKVKEYLNKCLLIANKKLEMKEKIKLLIILINKILYYKEKDNNFDFIEILNDIIKEIKDSEIFNKRIIDDDLNKIYNYYKRTIDLINERKNAKLNNFYDSINI